MQIHVVGVDWASHREALQRIRETVFVIEQKVPRELEWDGEDEHSAHFLALNEAGQALGCARLLPSGQIGRMAVLAEQRGTGLGQRLLEAAIEEAKQRGLTRVHLHAQTQAVGFYRRAGFLPVGGEFMEAGIAHQSMELELPIPFEPTTAATRPLVRDEAADTPPAADRELRQFHGEAACLAGLADSLTLPRRRLAILSQHLDPALFDVAAVVQALSAFARSAANVQVRVLLADSSLAVNRGHTLVELARRLDSRIEIRKVAQDTPPGDGSFVTWDDQGFFLLPDYREYTGAAAAYDPVQATRLREAFDYLWSRAGADPELRLLKL